jgi:hypothetical protein
VEDAGWITFRDVFEVDGSKVRDRDDRLVNLILKPARDSYEQATRIADEGARFNLGPISRTMNAPVLALGLLEPAAQRRSDFRIARMSRIDGGMVAEVEIREVGWPRLILTADDAAAAARAWIDPVSGTVKKTELSIQSRGARVTVTVTYRADARLGLWLPVVMSEIYELGGVSAAGSNRGGGTIDADQYGNAGRIEGYATYGNFRRFSVDTSTVIRKSSRDSRER